MQILWQAKMGRCHGNKWRPILSRGEGWLPPGWISRPRRARQWLFGLQNFFRPGIIHTQADSRRRCTWPQNRGGVVHKVWASWNAARQPPPPLQHVVHLEA